MKIKSEILKYIKEVGDESEWKALTWALETDPEIRDIGRRIVCAALKYDSGELIVGPRHFCRVMRKQLERCENNGNPEEGFIDQRGNFLDRKEAWAVADEAGQIIRRCGGDENKLYSENLY